MKKTFALQHQLFLSFLIYTLSFSYSFAQPANDVCSGAQSVNPNGTCYAGTTAAANDNWTGTVGCQSGNNAETWYTFTATNSQLAISVTNGTQTGNIEFILVESLTPPCGGLILAGSTCGSSVLTDTINGLQIGSTYYFTISSTGAAGTYTVCVNNIVAVPVAGQDCPAAAILCDNSTFTQATSNAGFGTQEVNTGNSCWGSGGERQSKWFKFTIGCSGTLEFNINPANSGDDYDWAIWDVTTACPTTANGNIELACNWSGCKGSTGISSCSNFASEPGSNKSGAGCGGQYAAWEPAPLNVTCGRVYALLVDNFSTSNNGFTLTWGGACAPGGTAVIGPDAAFTVASSNCNNTVTVTKTCCTTPNFTYLWNFGDGFTSTSAGPVTHTYTAVGTYIISLTVTDQLGCQKFSSVTISQTAITSTMATNSNVSCNGGNNGSATVTPTSGSAAYTYVWSPSGGTSATATGLSAGTYTVTITDANGCIGTQTVTITQPAVLTSSIGSSTNVSCNGGNNGSATVTAGGGTPSYTYSWSPSGGTTTSATGLSSGNYTVTVTDGNGCSKTSTVSITQPTALTVTTSTTNANCGSNNGTASATAGGGTPSYTYSWSNGQTTTTSTGLTAGSYTVTITDGNGCTQTDVANVSNAGSPTVTITSSSNVTCSGGNDGTASVSASGGSTPYTFSWCNGQTTTNATGLSSGSCNVTVTDNAGCVSVIAVPITEPTALTTSLNSTNVLCSGGSNGNATVSVSGGTPSYSYSWNNGQTTSTATGLSLGTYTVTITDGNSCTTTGTVSVSEPTALSSSISSQTNVSCNGGTSGDATVNPSGGSPSYTFSWSNGQTTSTATGLAFGNYNVTVTDANGCTTTQTVSINQPSALSSSISNSNVSCNGGTNGDATATPGGGTSPFTYLWDNGATTSANTGLPTGNYSVTIIDANGCTTTNTVAISEPTALTTTTTSTPSGCSASNGSATSTPSGASPPYTYLWSNGQTSSTATGLSAGSYTITITDANGCTLNDVATVVNTGAPSVTITPTDATCNGGTNGDAAANASGGNLPYTFSWDNGQTTSIATGLAAGTFTLTLTDGGGCIQISTVTINEPTAVSAGISSQTNVNCNGGNNGDATVVGSGGTPSYSYVWSNGQTTAIATGLSAGNYTVTITDANGCTTTTVAFISEPSALANIITTTQANCSSPNGTATSTPSGGTPAYTYLWSNSQTSQTATGLSAGNFSVTVTDANGCVSTSTLTITAISATITNTFTTTPASCATSNGTATSNPSGGTPSYTYLWSNAQTSQTATGLAAGIYTVTITDANGCTMTDVASVTNAGAPTLTVTATNVFCNGGSNGDATATASGGNPAYTYLWNNGQTTQTATGLSSGTYTITITDASGCVVIDTVSVLQPSSITATTTSTPSNCALSTGTATTSPNGGIPGYFYLWNNGQTTQTATGLTSGNYSVTITDANGCTFSDTVNVLNTNAPALSVSSNNASCNGGSNGDATANVTGGTSPYTFAWNNGQTSATATGLSAGNYTVVITDAAGCTQTDTISVAEPTQISSSVNTTNTCNASNDGTASVTPSGGTPGYSYSWNNGQTTSTATGLVAGNYSVTITDVNGCTSTSSVTVSSTTVTANISGNSSFCSGQNTTLTASGGTTYVWSSGDTSATVIISSAGNYSVIVTNGSCSDTATANVSVSSGPSANAGVNVTITQGDDTTLTGTGGGTYLWSPSTGLSCTTCSNPTANPTTTTIYLLEVTDANGCTAVDSVVVFVNQTECALVEDDIFIPNVFSPNDDGENDKFSIYSAKTCIQFFELAIFDRWGVQVFLTDKMNDWWDGTVNGIKMNTAVFVYYCRVVSTDNEIILKKGNVTTLK